MRDRRKVRFITVLGVVLSAGSMATTSAGASPAGLRVRLTPFPIPSGSQPTEIALGADGNLWFTLQNGSHIDRITLGGTITEFPTPSDSIPFDITSGPDGNVWFTEGSNGRIARITPGGKIREVAFSVFDTAGGITSGPDGNIWFTDTTGDRIWRLELPSLALTDFAVPTPDSFPGRITAGADGNLWFVESATGKIGRVTPDGVVTEPVTGLSNPFEITTAADGNVWFTEPFIQRYGKVTPAGQVTLYTSELFISSIDPGPMDNLIFTAFSDARIGTISLDGVVDASPPIDQIAPTGLTMGPDGAIWFLGQARNRVYRAVIR